MRLGSEWMNLARPGPSRYASILGLTFLTVGVCWSADESDIARRIDQSAGVVNEVTATPDKAIPEQVRRDAKCVAVIPAMVKIAIGLGGSHGKGGVTCRTDSGWSAPAPITLTQLGCADRRPVRVTW
jgi:SH3 domain-containing YSC84-like protein 1